MTAPHRREEWQEFRDWCHARHLHALPAHPWTVSAYALWLADNRRYRTLHKRLDIINRVHLLACKPTPEDTALVKKTVARIENRKIPAPKTAFTGEELLIAKKQAPQPSYPSKPAKPFSQTPPLVSRRPSQE